MTHSERFLNIHFFNPALLMTLVEVVPGPHTSEDTIIRAMDFARAIGKTPVRLAREEYGFIANRVLFIAIQEAMRLVEGGYISVEDCDLAVRNALGWPMGPFALSDLVGLDVVEAILDEGLRQTGDERWEPVAIAARPGCARQTRQQEGRRVHDHLGVITLPRHRDGRRPLRWRAHRSRVLRVRPRSRTITAGKGLEHVGNPASCGGAQVASAAASTSGRDDATATAYPAPQQHLDIVRRVADGHRVREREPESRAHDLACRRLADLGIEDLDELGVRAGDPRSVPASSRAIKRGGAIHLGRILDDARGLGGAVFEQRFEVRDDPKLHAADVRVQARLGTVALAEQLIVLVRLEVPVLLASDVQRAARGDRAQRLLEDGVDPASRSAAASRGPSRPDSRSAARARPAPPPSTALSGTCVRWRRSPACAHATARTASRTRGMQVLAVVDGRAVEIEDHDARDECPGGRPRLADIGERSHPTRGRADAVELHQHDLTQA